MPNLDRFAYGLKDAQNAPVLAECEECGGELYEGDEAYRLGADVMCSAECILEAIGTERFTVGE